MTKRVLYTKQKISLYFDENFPIEVVKELRDSKYWKKRCRVYSVFDFGNEKKDDNFQFNFCRKKGFTLVTIDKRFMDDKKYPFVKIPGIIRIIYNKNDKENISGALKVIVSFLSSFPFPKSFLGNSKFQVSTNQCIMRAKTFGAQKIKTIRIIPGNSVEKVAAVFDYPLYYLLKRKKN